MLDVLTIGDATYDIFIKPDAHNTRKGVITTNSYPNDGSFCFPVGSKIPVTEADFRIGGSAANVAVGLSRLGLETGVCTGLGEDNFAENIESGLNNENVSIDLVKRNRLNKTNFGVIIRGDKDRTVLVYHGMKDYSKLPLPSKPEAKWLYVSALGNGYEKILSKITALRAENDVKLAFNPGSVQLDDYKSIGSILRVTDILFVNYEEAVLASDWRGPKPSIKHLLSALITKGVKNVVITLGREGEAATNGTDYYQANCVPAKRIEVTGAGDAMATGFLASVIHAEKENEELSSSDLLKRSILWGAIESASVIEKIGAQTNLLERNTLESQAKAIKHFTFSEI